MHYKIKISLTSSIAFYGLLACFIAGYGYHKDLFAQNTSRASQNPGALSQKSQNSPRNRSLASPAPANVAASAFMGEKIWQNSSPASAFPVLTQPYYIPINNGREKSEWEKPATWISLTALLISLSLAGYTIWKDTRARRHSILDDYWFRKVIGPVTVEPLLKQILEMIAATPSDDWDDTFDPKRIRRFHDQNVKALSELAVNAYSLQLVKKNLGSEVATGIDDIQDLVITYCSGQAKRKGKACQGQRSTDFQSEARTKLFDLLAKIKNQQASLR